MSDNDADRNKTIWAAALAQVAAYLRRPNEDGTPCSAEREMLARRIERGEPFK